MNKPIARTLSAIALVAALATPATLSAHRQWMMPSSTVVSGDDVWVTVDAAVSNDLFYFEHQPLRLEPIKAWAPDGSEVKIENGSTSRYRSTFDVHLHQKGTYKIVDARTMIGGTYMLAGKQERLPRGVTADKLASAIPAGATDVKISESQNRNEIFVTSGEPNDTVLKPTGKGLELVPVTHPNDLIADEAATFQFVIDGKPAANIGVTVIPGGIRYRNDLKQVDLKTDAEGKVAINWTEPGMYWVNATASDSKTSVPGATERRLGYVTTLEVLAP
ncbi:DUF4198 domain-containing protein [Sphingomonas cavernae]|uniref:DUF4198 domain-containing protein n=1 Tax=Sphingomonas cavernae TaxID=2320861 RepID=A0A418WQF1_9SPHN|nr:DUF4198 domain-containing protein [Sphingomonas cavernae]RJF93436.1 DUF4198 domain-containing protein [Sphingomonas cavernae]